MDVSLPIPKENINPYLDYWLSKIPLRENPTFTDVIVVKGKLIFTLKTENSYYIRILS